MKVISATSARRAWSRMISRVLHAGERIAICRNGRVVAALVPYEELELLQALVDEADIEEARAAIRSERGKPPAAWAEIKRYTEIDR